MHNSYNSTISGPSGNITVNGTLTCTPAEPALTKRGLGAGKQTGVDLNSPPYAIHNGLFIKIREPYGSDLHQETINDSLNALWQRTLPMLTAKLNWMFIIYTA
jgi:hypothetical protein